MATLKHPLMKFLTLWGITCLATPVSSAIQASLTYDKPSDWALAESNNQAVVARFIVPRVEGDSEDAECVLLSFTEEEISGEEKLEQWNKQMLQPDDRPSEELATTTSYDLQGMKVTIIDVPGIYSPTVHPNSKMRYYKRGFRLKAAVIESSERLIFFKLTGPDRTVTHWNTAFSQLLDSIRTN